MAETYHVYDYKSLPVSLVGTLVSGLRDDSRIKMKASGMKAPLQTVVLVMMYDLLKTWATGGKNNDSLFDKLWGNQPEMPDKFRTGEDFNKAWEALTNE